VLALYIIAGCTHQVRWVEESVPRLPAPVTQIAVIAMEPACSPLADALTRALGSRPGVDVTPDAPQRVYVKRCDDLMTTRLNVEGNYPGLNYGSTVYFERRQYQLHAWGKGAIEVQAPGVEPLHFESTAEADANSGWSSSGDLEAPASPALRHELMKLLANELADHLVPLPEVYKRDVYPNPEPGTSRQLHNDAVAAERAGRLDEALRLARLAYAANPSPLAMDYVEALQLHAERVGYALKSP
jgi:hypothetical protein